ncbi:MAG: DNA helicase UvrD [Oxalobacter sp.]|nr:MAG: DNA helicase UvrD [Oxalobacter sp.]
MPLELDIFATSRGTVTAPAGCGKTQLITDTLKRHTAKKPVLVLTHTNAGAGALRTRLQRADVTNSTYRVMTIDGFAMRLTGTFPMRSGLPPNILNLDNPGRDYPTIRGAAWRLLQAGHLSDILQATYSRLIVDEYQDCSLEQHAIVDWAAMVLPTCVLGDPMQAIFNFRGNQLVDWDTNVLTQFPAIGELQTPWRWRNAGTETLGHWLLDCRQKLAGGNAIDLRTSPDEVTWVELAAGTEEKQRIEAARTRAPNRDGTVLVIGDSVNAQGRHFMASKTPGAATVEPVDLKDLTNFSQGFDVVANDALTRLVNFAGETMTNVGAPEFLRRINSIRQGTARNPPNSAEVAAITFSANPSLATALNVLRQISEQQSVRVYRPAILRSCMAAMLAASDGGRTFHAAAIHEREKHRHAGRPLSRRSVGSTLLLKGLEADVAVVLHPERMNAKHLYVALTRGARRVVVCSPTPILTPR